MAWPQGYRWLTFYEAGEWDSRLIRQYVYLGGDSIPVVPGHRCAAARDQSPPP